MLAGQTVLYTDINMIILLPLKKEGCRFDVHLHSSAVLSLLADSPQMAIEWYLSLSIHILKSYTSQGYAMQLPWNDIPRHFMFVPDSSRVVILFRSPIPQPKHELEQLSKVLFNPNAAHSRESLPSLFLNTFSNLWSNLSSPTEAKRTLSNKPKIEFLKYSTSQVPMQSHSNFEIYLEPISENSVVKLNPASPKFDKQAISAPADLSKVASLFRHMLDIMAFICNDNNIENIKDNSNDSIFSCDDEKKWLENIGISSMAKQYYIKLIYTHDAEAEIVKHSNELVFTYTDKKLFVRSTFYNFVCSPYSFRSFYSRGRSRGSINVTKLNEDLKFNEVERKRELSPQMQEKLEMEFSVDSLMIFFKHITEYQICVQINLILEQQLCQLKNFY